MNKKKATFLALIAVLISVSVPVTFAIFMAKKQSINAEKSRTLVYAKDVVHRTETMLDQFYSGVQILVNMHTPDSCSAESLAAMQNVDLSSSYIQAFGYVSDNHWICSSLGKHGTGVDLGIPNVITPRGSSLRYDVQFPFTPDRHFLVIENSNYAAIVHKDLTIDATTDIKEVSLGMFSKTGRYMIASRGYTKPEWVNKPLENGEAVFFDHGYLVVVTSSKRYGVSVAIDDFGTGYSSLSYLENLDIDYLKIDKSFVDTIGKEAATSHVVSHIIAIAKDLKLHMVAEGIESDYQAEFLRDNGVQYGQGWLFAQPMKIGELLSRL